MAGTETVVTKGRFAELCGVSPGRVTQWIAEGKIGKDALVGDGRGAKIIVAVAQRQIRARTDSGQAFGNGLGTKLGSAAPAPKRTEPPPDAATLDDYEPGDALDEQIKRERLEALQRANRKGAEEEAASQGRFVEAMAARRQMTVVAAQTMRVFEGAQPEIATAIASRFAIDEREVLLVLGQVFRGIRTQAAEKANAEAARLPSLVPDEAGDPAES